MKRGKFQRAWPVAVVLVGFVLATWAWAQEGPPLTVPDAPPPGSASAPASAPVLPPPTTTPSSAPATDPSAASAPVAPPSEPTAVEPVATPLPPPSGAVPETVPPPLPEAGTESAQLLPAPEEGAQPAGVPGATPTRVITPIGPGWIIRLMESVSFGPDDARDPFGVDYGGPLIKEIIKTADGSGIQRVTLQNLVDLLSVQAIWAPKEAIINDTLLKKGDSFELIHESGKYLLKIESIESGKMTFSWDRDASVAISTQDSGNELFEVVTQGDALEKLIAPKIPQINVTKTPTEQNK